MLLLNFSHRRQRFESDCLAACAEMALRLIEFETAWIEKDQEYAVIGLVEPA